MLVILKDENLPPMRWSLGRIIEVHPGADGIIRAIRVQISNNQLKWSVKSVAILPVDEEPADTDDEKGQTVESNPLNAGENVP